jgi:hypothetical protein
MMLTIDQQSYSHQPLSQALGRQRQRSRHAANFARPRTANLAAPRAAGPPIALRAGKTVAPIASIQIY